MTEGNSETVIIYGLQAQGGKVRYVGASVDPSHRLEQHMSDARSPDARDYRTPKSRWIRNLKHPPEVVRLEEVTQGDAAESEKRWIAFFYVQGNKLFNVLWFGPRPWLSEAARTKMAESARRRCKDPAHRALLSEIARERLKTPEGRAHLRRASALGVQVLKNDAGARQRRQVGIKRAWDEATPEQRASRVANAKAGVNAPGVQERKAKAISAAKLRRWAKKGWTKEHIESVIAESRNLNVAAASLGCTRPTLHQIRKHYGLT